MSWVKSSSSSASARILDEAMTVPPRLVILLAAALISCTGEDAGRSGADDSDRALGFQDCDTPDGIVLESRSDGRPPLVEFRYEASRKPAASFTSEIVSSNVGSGRTHTFVESESVSPLMPGRLSYRVTFASPRDEEPNLVAVTPCGEPTHAVTPDNVKPQPLTEQLHSRFGLTLTLPNHPIGVGAAWTRDVRFEDGTSSTRGTIRYELTRIEPGAFAEAIFIASERTEDGFIMEGRNCGRIRSWVDAPLTPEYAARFWATTTIVDKQSSNEGQVRVVRTDGENDVQPLVAPASCDELHFSDP
jgi:hypothetical protein